MHGHYLEEPFCTDLKALRDAVGAMTKYPIFREVQIDNTREMASFDDQFNRLLTVLESTLEDYDNESLFVA